MPRDHDTHAHDRDRFATVTQRVWRDVWKIVLPGAGLGVLAMLLGQFADSQDVRFVPELLHEVGTGFIVGCISVFGWEYLRDVSGVVKKQNEFRAQVAIFKQINDRESKKALRDDVLLLLDHQRLADAPVDTVKQAVDIYERDREEAPRRRRGESVKLQSEPCLTLLADLTHDALSPIAKTLNAFHNDVSYRHVTGSGHDYRMPDARDTAGKVLSMLLGSLVEGDYYKSVANVLFYENTLMNYSSMPRKPRATRASTSNACSMCRILKRISPAHNVSEHARPSFAHISICRKRSCVAGGTRPERSDGYLFRPDVGGCRLRAQPVRQRSFRARLAGAYHGRIDRHPSGSGTSQAR